MNTEEYKVKIKELRKERDFHQFEANRIAHEMDELVNSVDKENVNWMIGKYLKIDRRDKGGYLKFFYVDSIDTRPRGYTFYGKGFPITEFGIRLEDTFVLFVETDNLECVEETTKENFYKAFDEYVKLIREKLSEVKNYKTLGDQFEFKKSVLNSTMELRDENSLSNKVLNVLKDKNLE